LTQASDTSTDSLLFAQLQKLIENAEKVRSEPFQKFKDELLGKLLSLRPSVGGISAVSCCENSPQLGFSDVSTGKLKKILEKQLPSPGRPTPEKQLQSWLIQQAMRSNGRLKVLDNVLGNQYWFVSDEIALKSASGKKLVADMLTVQVDSAGLASLVNVELKSLRSMETFRQIISFRYALENPSLQEGWKKFAEVMTGKDFQWHPSQETHGVVIWPAVKPANGKAPTKARANAKRKEYPRVDVIGYECASEYTLNFEEPAENA